MSSRFPTPPRSASIPIPAASSAQGIPSVINPFDLHAVEAALKLRDQHGGHVTALSMGPPQAEETLRKVLGFGVDRAVLLTDRAFAGADTLATTHALAAAIRKIARR